MARERDLFANFERMRREVDEVFGDAFGVAGLTSRRTGFTPAVDVFYADDPPRAVVHAELAGVHPDDLGLEVQGRELTLTGHRRAADAEDRVYQQLEIEHGPFRRTLPLGAEVVAEQARASYRDGILRVELPLARPKSRTRTVPIERAKPPDASLPEGDGAPDAGGDRDGGESGAP
ncbi:MAG: Hsp20/alpha crystallin family protein [Actinomycetota bacterium]|nr:Hsp20/alpha crystallin family protein [Actinomycetota bacterium]